jgi:hypothetical protein
MKVTIGDVTYNVEGTDDPVLAVKHAKEFAQQDLNKKAQDEYKDASGIAKPFMAAQDVARTLADTASFGYADKFTDYMKPPIPGQPSQADITKAIRSRMSGADVGADVVAAVGAAPTAVPKVVSMLGGGPIARAITGGATAATEGGVLGGINAAGHDRPVSEGAGAGILSGVGGQTLAGLLTKPVNAIANRFSGANKALPPITDSQFKQASKIVGDDPATKAFSGAGELLSRFSYPAAFGDVSSAIAMATGGKAAKFVANQGRKEKVDAMRRMVGGNPKVKGPLSEEERLALGIRGRLFDYLNED